MAAVTSLKNAKSLVKLQGIFLVQDHRFPVIFLKFHHFDEFLVLLYDVKVHLNIAFNHLEIFLIHLEIAPDQLEHVSHSQS